MMAAEFGSTGICEMSVFHGLSDANGRKPFRFDNCPVLITEHAVWLGAEGGTAGVVGVGEVPGGAVELLLVDAPPPPHAASAARKMKRMAGCRLIAYLASLHHLYCGHYEQTPVGHRLEWNPGMYRNRIYCCFLVARAASATEPPRGSDRTTSCGVSSA